jgi:hypothetical protein
MSSTSEVFRERTSRLPAILATLDAAQRANVLMVRPINSRGSDQDRPRAHWQVVHADGKKERLRSAGKGKAIDHAVERLSGADGGEVLVMNFLGEIVERARVPAQPLGSCAEILKAGQELHSNGVFSACPFCVDISPEMLQDERELAAALFFLWHDQQGTASGPMSTRAPLANTGSSSSSPDPESPSGSSSTRVPLSQCVVSSSSRMRRPTIRNGPRRSPSSTAAAMGRCPFSQKGVLSER